MHQTVNVEPGFQSINRGYSHVFGPNLFEPRTGNAAGDLFARSGSYHDRLDVVINNAGIFRTIETFPDDGLDIRFAVNIFAPYLLTQRLLPLLGRAARVVNLSSAAQSPVDLEALAGRTRIPNQLTAYAQSKLALTMWSRTMGHSQKDNGVVFSAVNPGSLLATKMVYRTGSTPSTTRRDVEFVSSRGRISFASGYLDLTPRS